MKLLGIIKNIGASKGEGNPVDVGVLNLSLVLLIVPGFPYAALFYQSGFYEAAMVLLATSALASICFPLVKRGNKEAAKYLYVIVSILGISTNSVFLHQVRGVNILLLVIIGISFIISKRGDKKLAYTAILLSTFCYLLSVYFSDYGYDDLSPVVVQICNFTLFPIGFIVIGIIVGFYSDNLNVALDEKSTYIHSLQQTQEELTAQSEALESVNAQLEEFTYIASHDLKTPIRGIHHYAQFLEEDFKEELPAEAFEMLEGIKKLADKMDMLVNDVLSFSKAEKADLEIEAFNLADTIQVVKEDIEGQPDITIDISYSADMPTIKCDKIGMREAILNFVTNAYKYNDASEKRINFTFDTATNELKITDNGIGIAKENLDKVFAFFKRVHGKNEYGGGTGAGLAIVQKILERQGITIEIESEVGRGTTFILNLSETMVEHS